MIVDFVKFFYYQLSMKKFIKAVIIGYAVIWVLDALKKFLGDNEVTTLEDIKKLIKEKL